MLIAAGGVFLLFAVANLAALLGGPSWLEFAHAPPNIVESARAGTLVAPITVGVVVLLAVAAGGYALSGGGLIRPLPFRRFVLVVLALICLIRAGLWGLTYAVAPAARPYLYDPVELASALFFMFAGLAVAVGLMRRWSELGKTRQ